MSNVKKEMKSLEKLKNKMNTLLSKYGTLQKVHSHELFEDLQKGQNNKYIGNIVTLKKCNVDCPSGFSKIVTEDKCQCISTWNKNCGQNCAFKKCSEKNLEWVPLDYTKNPYTCESKQSSLSEKYFVTSDDKLRKLDIRSSCSRSPLSINKYVQGFLENNGFTLGKPLTKGEPCQVTLSSNSYTKNVKNVNKELMKLANKIHKKIISLQKRIQVVDHETSIDEQQIKEDLQEYDNFIKTYKNFNSSNPSLQAIKEDVILRAKSQYTQYLLYLSLVVLLLFFIFYHLRK